MPDERHDTTVLGAAEEAMHGGKIEEAARLLAQELKRLETLHGPDDPVLVSILNNLAVLRERTGQVDEAAQHFQRAYAIASAALPASDPVVVMSLENLREFADARGLELDAWGITEIAHAGRHARTAPDDAAFDRWTDSPAPRPPESLPPRPVAVPAASAAGRTTPVRSAAPGDLGILRPGLRRERATWPWAALGASIVLAAVGFWSWRGAAEPTVSAPVEAPASADNREPAPTIGERTPPPAAVAPDPTPGTPASTASAATTPADNPSPAPPAAVAAAAPVAPPVVPPIPRPDAESATTPSLRIVTADLCGTLTTGGRWICEAIGPEAPPGRASFYTRVAAPTNVRVQHVWIQGDTVRQTVTLAITANPREGYRTFSRQTLGPGQWRVQLRDTAGAVLHEARVAVR